MDPCRTQWILRIDGLARFLEMYAVIYKAISIMSDNIENPWNGSDAYAFVLLCRILTSSSR